MFTEQDLKKLKKIQLEYYQRKQSEQNSSSGIEYKTEQELYISKYLLNDGFKILHIDIIGTEEVQSSLAPYDTYINYIIKILTEDFSYDVSKRYSQFLKLYETIKTFEISRNNQKNNQQTAKKINLNKITKNQYNFPIKRISSSLRHFFHVSSKQKLAQQRKSELCSFLNQIKNNYGKYYNSFMYDYIELLKFINMKTQHQKFWRKKQGRILEISNIPNQIKSNQKQNQQINVQYLTQLLQHQMNKINLAITVKQSVYKSSPNLTHPIQEIKLDNDIMVTDEIIKNVDCVRDIVFQLKKKINYDHIRCIIKGKDIKQTSNSLTKIKNGLIQYSLKHSTNQLVSIHIIRTILFVFANSECNYSSDAFIKVLTQLDLSIFALNQDKQQLALSNKQFRQMYFKLLKLYTDGKQQYGNDRKVNVFDKIPIQKLMGLSLVKQYQTWNQNNIKNKQFKLKDDQKDWKLVIQNFPRSYSPKKTHQSFDVIKAKNTHLQQPLQAESHFRRLSKLNKELDNKKPIQKAKLGQIKKFQNQNIIMSLITQQNDEQFYYFLSCKIKNKTYEACLEIMKHEKIWNPLLIHSQVDVYSNTRKDLFQMPGKHQKTFRFIQRQQIQMDFHNQQENKLEQLDQCQHFIAVGNQQEQNQNNNEKQNPKTSTQTMPSTNGSCAHQHQPQKAYKEPHDGLAKSKLSQKFILIKSPPQESVCHSFHQRIQVQRLPRQEKFQQPCGIQIQIIFSQSTAKKFFISQISGATEHIWQGFKKAFQIGPNSCQN